MKLYIPLNILRPAVIICRETGWLLMGLRMPATPSAPCAPSKSSAGIAGKMSLHRHRKYIVIFRCTVGTSVVTGFGGTDSPVARIGAGRMMNNTKVKITVE